MMAATVEAAKKRHRGCRDGGGGNAGVVLLQRTIRIKIGHSHSNNHYYHVDDSHHRCCGHYYDS